MRTCKLLSAGQLTESIINSWPTVLAKYMYNTMDCIERRTAYEHEQLFRERLEINK